MFPRVSFIPSVTTLSSATQPPPPEVIKAPYPVERGLLGAVRWQEPSTASLKNRAQHSGRRHDASLSRPSRTVSNWPLFWHRLTSKSQSAELVWHDAARLEFCRVLIEELEALEAAGAPSHQPFLALASSAVSTCSSPDCFSSDLPPRWS